MDEVRLIERIRCGECDALADFIEIHRPRLLAFIRTITGEHLLARVEVEDLLQEVAVGAVAALPNTEYESLEPMGWLQQLARRRVVDAHRFHFGAERRAAGRQQSLDQAFGDDSQKPGLAQMLIASITSPSAVVSRDLRLSKVQEALQSLSQEQQTVIRMRYVDGLATKEIAGKLGKSDASIRVTLTRSIRKLEELLAHLS